MTIAHHFRLRFLSLDFLPFFLRLSSELSESELLEEESESLPLLLEELPDDEESLLELLLPLLVWLLPSDELLLLLLVLVSESESDELVLVLGERRLRFFFSAFLSPGAGLGFISGSSSDSSMNRGRTLGFNNCCVRVGRDVYTASFLHSYVQWPVCKHFWHLTCCPSLARDPVAMALNRPAMCELPLPNSPMLQPALEANSQPTGKGRGIIAPPLCSHLALHSRKRAA